MLSSAFQNNYPSLDNKETKKAFRLNFFRVVFQLPFRVTRPVARRRPRIRNHIRINHDSPEVPPPPLSPPPLPPQINPSDIFANTLRRWFIAASFLESDYNRGVAGWKGEGGLIMNTHFKILTTCFYCLSRAFPSKKLFLGGDSNGYTQRKLCGWSERKKIECNWAHVTYFPIK